MGWSKNQEREERGGNKIVDMYHEESATKEDDNYFNSVLLLWTTQ